MKTKMFLLAAAFSSGIAMLGAQDAPKPPQPPGGEGRPGGPGGPPGGGDPQARFDEIYLKMDADKDGKISKVEFIEFSKGEAEDRFSKIDTSGSGSITKEQIAEVMRRSRGGDTGQRRPEGFRRPEGGDSGGTRPRPSGDGNPPPPPPEGSTGGPGGPGGPGGQGMRGGSGGSALGEIFRKVQEGGSVTKEEYVKISEEGFKRLDSNGDGKITMEDLEEMRKRMGAGQGGSPGGPPQGGGGGSFRRPPAGDAPQGDRPKRPETN